MLRVKPVVIAFLLLATSAYSLTESYKKVELFARTADSTTRTPGTTVDAAPANGTSGMRGPGSVKYHGGRLTSGNLNFHVVYASSQPAEPTFMPQIEQFIKDLPKIGSFWNVFGQYSGQANASLTGVASVVSRTWKVYSGTLFEKDIETYIKANYLSKGVTFGVSDVLVFLLGSDVGFVQMGAAEGQAGMSASCIGFCGVHLVGGEMGNAVPYAVIPSFEAWPCNSACYTTPTRGNLTNFQATTLVLSHEISEIFTDTYENKFGLGYGFFVDTPGEYEGYELADVCQHNGYVGNADDRQYVLTKVWSAQDAKCFP
ncbi:hypothetical protein SeMB42_g02150 [Synchytrium endobioticum]|uniref:Uncharacterized protein n=1 Tax=Synchytrium endobioticum TaxID=286115 RepID=A0A507CPA9_9FUNG|nr:hypothetical protein SeLEV6574_g06310 [Synchytrium endobioticum]TPX50735.1 hypothetical protein SeMB42_g02150 [Synchytrium endobioticum]